MATPTQAQQPRIAEEIRKMESEPIDSVESKLIWYTFFGGLILLVVLVWVSSMVR